MGQNLFKIFVLFYVVFSSPSWSSQHCKNCLDLVAEIRTSLNYLRHHLNAIENMPRGGQLVLHSRNLQRKEIDALDLQEDGYQDPHDDRPLFYQRLEAQIEFENSQMRIEKIEQVLTDLLEEIEEEQARLEAKGGGSDEELVNLSRLQRLAEAQKLILQELQKALKKIEKKFNQLDQQLEAHEVKIEAVEKGVEKIDKSLAEWLPRIRAHITNREEVAFKDITTIPGKGGGAPGPRRLFQFPRTELKLDNESNTKVQVTHAVGGKLGSIVEGKIEGGLIFNVILTTQTYLLSSGLKPLLTRHGATTREAASFCTTSVTFVRKGFGAIEGSAGVDFGVIYSKTKVRVERGRSITLSAKKYSKLREVPQGTTLNALARACESFTDEIADTAPLSDEIFTMLEVAQIPETTCYKDFDCRGKVSGIFLGSLLPSVVSQCFVKNNRQKAICAYRSIESHQASDCTPHGEAISNFRYHCAKGYTCNSERRCVRNKSPRDHLTQVGLVEARVLPSHFAKHIFSKNPDSKLWEPKKEFCSVYADLPSERGWRLPSRNELPGVSRWFREWWRELLRYPRDKQWRNKRLKWADSKVVKALLPQMDRFPKKPSAQSWFYPSTAFKGLVWSNSFWVYLLNNDSMAQFNPNHVDGLEQFRTGEGKLPPGVTICVRPGVSK